MDVSIYLNENEELSFLSYSAMRKRTDSNDPKRTDYRMAWFGKVDAENLEDVFRIFNQDQPESYKERSLSVGDIVGNGEGLYYCDDIGWTSVKWKESDMLRSEYEGITGTSVYWDIYRDLIEPMYYEAPPWMTKYDFCALINAKDLSEIPAVPNCYYIIDNKPFVCKKVDIVKGTVEFESYIHKMYITMSFEEAAALRKKESMRPA